MWDFLYWLANKVLLARLCCPMSASGCPPRKRSSGQRKSTPSPIAVINSTVSSSQLNCDSNVHTSREGYCSIHERCHLDSSYYGNQEYTAGKLRWCKILWTVTFIRPFAIRFKLCAIPPICIGNFDGHPRKYVRFMLKFHATISSKVRPQSRIHYLIAANEVSPLKKSSTVFRSSH